MHDEPFFSKSLSALAQSRFIVVLPHFSSWTCAPDILTVEKQGDLPTPPSIGRL
jgi:hypothetical protein